MSGWMAHARRSACAALACAVVLLGMALPARAISLLSVQGTTVDLGGDVKAFTVAVFPYAHPLMPSDPSARGLLDLRLKLDGAVGDWLRLTLHPNVFASFGPAVGGLGLGGAASARLGTLPEAISLSRTLTDAQGFTINARVDRASIMVRLPHVEITAGRQPITFGSMYVFTPLDIISPFTPLVVDREYKPGLDALRGDAFVGTSTKLTMVAAYGGAWNLDGLIFAGHARTTVAGVDVGAFAASAHRDLVAGISGAGDLLGFGIRGEATLTVPPGGRVPFVRMAVGADRRLAEGLMVTGELYAQSLGAGKPGDYMEVARLPEVTRGEVWTLGRYYAALSATYELMPMLTVGNTIIANLGDVSALMGPSLTWSLADEAVLVAGGYVTMGDRPAPEPSPNPAQPLQLRSEYGTAPASAFLQFKAYF